MLDAQSTFNNGIQVGRMFPQGIEAKQIWFQGNRIFSLSDGVVEITLPREMEISAIITCGDFVVCVEELYTSLAFHRFKDGQYVSTVTAPTYGYPIYSLHYDVGMVLFQYTNNGKKYMQSFSYAGLSQPIEVQGVVSTDGIVFGDKLFVGCYTIYAPGSTNYDASGGNWYTRMPEEARTQDGIRHFPILFQYFDISGGIIRDYHEVIDYAFPLEQQYSRDASNPTVFDRPAIFSMRKDVVTGKVYACVGTQYYYNIASEYYHYLYVRRCEVTGYDENTHTFQLGSDVPNTESKFVPAVLSRSYYNFSSYVFLPFIKYGNYSIEKGSTRISGTEVYGKIYAYAINDFLGYLTTHLPTRSNNDSNYREPSQLVFFNASMPGYDVANRKYYAIAKDDTKSKMGSNYSEWNEGINVSDDSVTWVKDSTLGSADIGYGYAYKSTAWNRDGIYKQLVSKVLYYKFT